MIELMIQLLLFFSVVLIALYLYYFRPVSKVPSATKAVLITGCDSGFGLALAKLLAIDGYLVFAGCLDANSLGAKELTTVFPHRCCVLQLNVTSDEEVHAGAQFIQNSLQNRCLWAVVNNAGCALFTETEWCSVSEHRRLLEVNALGAVRVTQALLPLLRQCQGRVINVASQAGRICLPGFSAYSMSKAALIAYSDVLRYDTRKFGMHISTIEPGLYKTSISDTTLHMQYNDNTWSTLSSEVKQAYGGPQYLRALKLEVAALLTTSRSDTRPVLAAMQHAVTSTWPKRRYVPSIVNRLVMLTVDLTSVGNLARIMAIIMPLQSGTSKPKDVIARRQAYLQKCGELRELPV